MFIIERSKCRSELKSINGKIIPQFIVLQLQNKFSFVNFENIKNSRVPVRTVVKLFKNDNTFYSGLAPLIVKELSRLGYDCSIIDKYDYSIDIDKALNRINKCKYVLRDYQMSAIAASIKKNLTSISLPTGSGKSIVIAALLLADNLDTLIVVDNKTLMYQLVGDIHAITGIKCGMIGDGQFAPYKWTVGITDSLLTERGMEYIQDIKALYFDEAHHLATMSCEKIVNIGKDNIIVRRGFSATIMRNDNKQYLLPSLTGPIVCHISTSDLIKSGWLAEADIFIKRITKPKDIRERFSFGLYSKCIINNQRRNNIGLDILIESVKNNNLSVGFFRNVVKHLPYLSAYVYKYLRRKDVEIICGNTPGVMRSQILKRFKEGDIKLLLLSIGTSGEGFDLPGEAKCGVNFCGGTSEIVVRQMLGRLLRKPKNPKTNEVETDKAFNIKFLDFNDEMNPVLATHAENRIAVYKSENAFNVTEL